MGKTDEGSDIARHGDEDVDCQGIVHRAVDRKGKGGGGRNGLS